jgi:hypothetical protein
VILSGPNEFQKNESWIVALWFWKVLYHWSLGSQWFCLNQNFMNRILLAVHSIILTLNPATMKLEDPPWAVTRPYCQLLEHLTRSHGLQFLVHILFGIALFKVILLPEKPKTTSPNPKSKEYLKSTDQSLIPKRKGRYRSPSDPFFSK